MLWHCVRRVGVGRGNVEGGKEEGDFMIGGVEIGVEDFVQGWVLLFEWYLAI